MSVRPHGEFGAVAKLREKYYGPLKMPSEIAALSARIDAYEKATDIEFNNLRAEANEAVKIMRDELASMVKRNGWAK